MIKYSVLSTGSKGNAVVIKNFIMIDCGVPFRQVKDYVSSLKLVLLTHEHGDHFRATTIKRLATERPTLRFGIPEWLLEDTIKCGVSKSNIDVYKMGVRVSYGKFSIQPFELVHNVRNCCYKIYFTNEKMIYATDTNSLDGIEAKDFDLYLIESNYEEDEIMERIKVKKETGEYPYELGVLHNHLSKEKADSWLMENMGANSEYVYLHEHED